MSHRKIHSQGSIPFSWEDKPGVSRITTNHHHEECTLDKGIHALNLDSSKSPSPQPPRLSSCDSDSFNLLYLEEKKLPLPPCASMTPRRSTSLKGITGWWQEDPFLAAYKECTKSARSSKKSGATTNVGTKRKKKKSRFGFSCKSSCEIRDDNFVMLSNLPPILKENVRTSNV